MKLQRGESTVLRGGGKVWIFSGTTHYKEMLILVLLWKNIAVSFLLCKVLIFFAVSLFNPWCINLEWEFNKKNKKQWTPLIQGH